MPPVAPAAQTTLPRFDIFTRAAEVLNFDDGELRIKATASSSMIDLSGDEIKLPALQRMVDQATQGMPIFFNHKYQIPEDVAGYIDSADIHQAGTDDHGEPVYDVDLGILLDKENPRSVQTHKSLAGAARVKAKLGISIGALIKHATKKKSGGYLIDDIEWLEASIVGIPQNRRSWTHYAAKSLDAYEKEGDGEVITAEADALIGEAAEVTMGEAGPELVKAPLSSGERSDLPDSAFACPEQRKYPIRDASGKLDPAHVRNALARIADPSNDQCGRAKIEAAAKELGIGGGEKGVEDEVALAVEPDKETAVSGNDAAVLERQNLCPSCGGTKKSPKGDCNNSFHDEPDSDDMGTNISASTTPAETQAIEPAAVGVQEAPSGASPESTPSVTSPTIPPATEAVMASTEDIGTLIGHLRKVMALNGTLIDENLALKSELRTVKAARDEAVSERNDAIGVVDRLSKLPLPSKTRGHVDEASVSLHERFGMYDDAILKRLK